MRLVFVAGALAALLAGCNSTVNQEACTTYVDHLNSLACLAGDVDAADACGENLDNNGATACKDYFACLTENARCEGDTYIAGVDECTACEVRD